LPTTLIPLMGHRASPCMIGKDLFNDTISTKRHLVSIKGDNHENLHVYNRTDSWSFNKKSNALISNTNIPEPDWLIPFLRKLETINLYLTTEGNYKVHTTRDKPPIFKNRKPFLVSHKGNTIGPQNVFQENKPKNINLAINSGYKWVEIDITLTKDNIPIVLHNGVLKQLRLATKSEGAFTLSQIRRLKGMSDTQTLAEYMSAFSTKISTLVELKNQGSSKKNLILAKAALSIINKYPSAKIIFDSFSYNLVKLILKFGNYNTGWDHPFNKRLPISTLKKIRKIGVNWLYVRWQDLLKHTTYFQQARNEGFQLMIYTINKKSIFKDVILTKMADGIITDYKEVHTPKK